MRFETIGERIKNLRVSQKMSQEDLAAKLNTTKQAIYKYENNIVTNIPMDKIEQISNIFEVRPSYIMGWNGGIGDRIKMLRLDWKLTQAALASCISRSVDEIQSWEYGRTTPDLDAIEELAKVFDVTKEQLIADDLELLASLRFRHLYGKDIRRILKKRFPMLGEIACGQPIFANEEYDAFVDASADIDADFCLTARGDSMRNTGIKNGDIVFIKQRPIVDNGEIAAVIIDGEATLKYWFYYPEKQKLVLNPANPNYEPLVYVGTELDEITCLGKAVCYMSKL